jgi:hypothetical protein
MKFYIYCLISSLDEKVFYVGKGSGKRMYSHVRIAKSNGVNRDRNPHLYNKISKILLDGGSILYDVVFMSDDENEVYIKEKEFINNIGLENLTNLREGGIGGLIGEWDDERKNKLRLSRIGKSHSDETKEKIRNKLKGVPTGRSYWKDKSLSEETKEKMSKSGKGKNRGPISEKRRLSIIEGIRKKKEEKESIL